MTDPLVDTPAFREAVEAHLEAYKQWDSPSACSTDNPCDPMGQCDNHRAEQLQASLLAAAPHLERHFRAKLAEELRAEGKRCDPTHAYPRGPGRWLDAADHLTRPEVMG